VSSFGPFVLAALVLLSPAPARAMTPEDEAVVARGLDALYMSDFDGAERIFREAQKSRPGDPVASLGFATAVWWRMENDFAPPGSADEKAFADAVKEALGDAKRARDHGGDKAEASLCLGAAYGLRARREAALHHWFSAYFAGKKAYRDAQKAVALNPELYDAYLGIGSFDYYVATLSSFVRAFAFTSGGGREKGLAELQLATRGRYSGVAAELLLVGIDWTFEKKPQDAWKILEELHAKYPESPMIDSMRLIGLFHLRDGAALKKEASAFLAKAERGAPFFRPLDVPGGRYFLGLGEQLSGEYVPALAEYESALAEVPAQHGMRSMLHLFIGECQDLQGRRDEALASYRQALKDPPLWGVPRYAKYLLKRPFQPGDNPLPARNDELP
jgi:tetratricopeptide (TPR) repeat protein